MNDAGLGSSEPSRSERRPPDPPRAPEGAGGERDQPRPANAREGAARDARLRSMLQEQYDFIWRSLRRLGVPSTDVDDCAQQVFWVAARKLEAIEAGCERAFLFSTALRVASDARRTRVRRREVPDDDETQQPCDPSPRPDEIADQRRARALLDEVLSSMPIDLRAVFVLFELEEMATADIAKLLEIPSGTAASRLRRAREEFHAIVARVQKKGEFEAQRAGKGGRQ